MDLQIPDESVADPFDHIGKQTLTRSVERPLTAVIAGTLHRNAAAFHGKADAVRKRMREFSLRSLNRNRRTIVLNGDFGRKSNAFIADS
jgi:hypothetical protein